MEARMKKTCFLFLVTILLLGCAAFPVAITPTPSLIPPVVTPSTLPEPTDPTQLLTVKAGKNFDIVLPANASTGYAWQITSTLDAGLIQSVGQNYIAEQPVIPGSGGMNVWTFTAVAPGATEIQFGYFPPGNTTQAEETVIFSISIE
jgi:inhibitor of cysteine peptidase